MSFARPGIIPSAEELWEEIEENNPKPADEEDENPREECPWGEDLEGSQPKSEVPRTRATTASSDFENPLPQPKPDRLERNTQDGAGDPVPLELSGQSRAGALGTEKDKLAIATVGLPGCGKTHLVRRIERYLKFFHSASVKSFIVEDYRRSSFGASVPPSFFDCSDGAAYWGCWSEALTDLRAFLSEGSKRAGPQVGIFDALNLTRERRLQVLEELQAVGARVLFIEVTTDDPALHEAYLSDISSSMPDYHGREVLEVREDFAERVDSARAAYEPINAFGDERHLSWVKSTNMEALVVNRVRSYLPGRVVQLLLSLHPRKRTVYLSRHGESVYNALGLIGGDSALTARGREYALRLAKFADDVVRRDARGEVRPARLWTSTLRRTRETASYISPLPCRTDDGRPFESMRCKAWTNLDEIYAGICDGMTYRDIQVKFPVEASRRGQNKLCYRYPRGESYMDLIQRLEPIAHELERHQEPLLIVGHQAVLRVLYCYLKGIPREDAPRIPMPLHTVVRLEPHTYGCAEDRIELMQDQEGTAMLDKELIQLMLDKDGPQSRRSLSM